jgi:hypothetical protein
MLYIQDDYARQDMSELITNSWCLWFPCLQKNEFCFACFKPHSINVHAVIVVTARCEAVHSVESAVRAVTVEYGPVPESTFRRITYNLDKQCCHVLQERPVERFGFGGVATVQLYANRRFALSAQSWTGHVQRKGGAGTLHVLWGSTAGI